MKVRSGSAAFIRCVYYRILTWFWVEGIALSVVNMNKFLVSFDHLVSWTLHWEVTLLQPSLQLCRGQQVVDQFAHWTSAFSYWAATQRQIRVDHSSCQSQVTLIKLINSNHARAGHTEVAIWLNITSIFFFLQAECSLQKAESSLYKLTTLRIIMSAVCHRDINVCFRSRRTVTIIRTTFKSHSF